MNNKKKQIKKGYASRVVVLAAVAAVGAGVFASSASAIQDNGRMVEENALLLLDRAGGLGEDGFYLGGGGFINIFKPVYLLFHQALVAPVAILGALSSFNLEGYEDQ